MDDDPMLILTSMISDLSRLIDELDICLSPDFNHSKQCWFHLGFYGIDHSQTFHIYLFVTFYFSLHSSVAFIINKTKAPFKDLFLEK